MKIFPHILSPIGPIPALKEPKKRHFPQSIRILQQISGHTDPRIIGGTERADMRTDSVSINSPEFPITKFDLAAEQGVGLLFDGHFAGAFIFL